jgi:ATP-binding cassette subfamily B protein
VTQPSPKPSLWLHVLRQTKGHRPRLVLIFALELLSTPLALLSPLGIKIAIDSVVGGKPLPPMLGLLFPRAFYSSPGNLLFLAVALQLFVVLLIQVHGFCNYLFKTSTGETLTLEFRKQLFRHLQQLPLKYHDTRGTADSSFRVQDDAAAIKSITVDGALFLLSDIVKLAAIVCITMFINAPLAFVALSVCPLLVVYSIVYQKRVGGRYKEVRKMESFAVKSVQEALSAIRVVKAFAQQHAEESRFAERAKQAQQQRIGGMALVLLFGIRSVQAGSMTLGSLLMVITYLVQLYTPLQNITYHIASLQSSGASVERALEVLREKPESNLQTRISTEGRTQPTRAAGCVEFRNVTFGYSPGRPVLDDISLHVPKGSRVGIIGQTGAGKTTFVDMLVRFHDPDSGQVLLDGIDLRQYSLNDLRQQFAFVLQDPSLFSATIAHNISYGTPAASQEQIIAAAKSANAHDFIMRLPDGYETEIGERGSMISGGERQRISLARAFLKNAPILILDEPTSALDSRTETDVLRAMDRLMVGRTTFFISHRLSTLSNCDILLKLSDSKATVIRVPDSIHEIESFAFGRNDRPVAVELVS